MTAHVRKRGVHSAFRRALLAATFAASCSSAPPPVVVPPAPVPPGIARLQKAINETLADSALARGTWGITVKSIGEDQTLYALNAGKLLMPASTLKLVTLATAADRLGWDYRYYTHLLVVGNIEGGVLNGDLLIVGSGDPTIDDWSGDAGQMFANWATLLQQHGVRSVSGRVIGDDNVFDDEGLGNGWAWDDLGASYATSVGGLQFNQNTAQFVIAPAAAGQPPLVEARPDAARLSFLNLASTSSETATRLTVRPNPRTSALEITGTITQEASPVVRNVSVANPTLYFANAARDALIHNGIDILGPAVDIDDLSVLPDRSAARPIAERSSNSLAVIGRTMMTLSQNLYAETLLKTLGAHESGIGSTAAGRAAESKALEAWGVPSGDVQPVDGSGLSRYNLATAEALVTVLAHVHADSRLRDSFMATLSSPGDDGTLSQRLKATSAEARVRAKTGSMSNVRALAGYIRTAGDEPMAFAILVNNYGGDSTAVDRAIDAIVVALAEFSRR